MFQFIAKNVVYNGENENTIVIIHRHWFDILKNLFLIFLMVAFLIGLYMFMPLLFPFLEDGDYYGLFMLFESFFFMLTLLLFFLIWIDYYFDVWVITNKRIINIEQKGLFSREISELELDKIQDVSASVAGIIPTFLNYGNILIQTAGEREKFVFRKISDPYAIKDLIMSLEKKMEKSSEKEKAITEAQEIKSALQETEIH